MREQRHVTGTRDPLRCHRHVFALAKVVERAAWPLAWDSGLRELEPRNSYLQAYRATKVLEFVYKVPVDTAVKHNAPEFARYLDLLYDSDDSQLL